MQTRPDLEKDAAVGEQQRTMNLKAPRTRSIPSIDHPLEEALDAEANIALDGGSKFQNGILPPPNGGLTAWMQVVGSFFLFFNSWGLVNGFGVFQTYYENSPLWSQPASNISWIGSIQAFLLLLVGVITGPLYDKGHFRLLVSCGAVLVPLGLMMTSLCRTYWQTILAQSVVIGIGNGCLFVPSVALLPQYFSTRKALANGLAASGSSVGGVIYPVVFRQLEQRIGFGWATRVLGFISLVTCWFSVLVMKQRAVPKQKRKMVDLSAFRETPYTLFSIGMFFAFIGFYGPIYYLSSYAISMELTTTSFAFYLLPMLNAASVPGRILPNYLTDRVGPFNVLMPAALVTGILAFVWIGIKNLGGIVAFSLLYGFFSGAFVSLPPVAIVTLTTDMSKLGTRMGQMFFVSAFGLLVGTPISGAILTSTGGYLGVQLFSGFTILGTGCLVVAARVYHVGWNPLVKS